VQQGLFKKGNAVYRQAELMANINLLIGKAER
jgi:hypothetical protein